MKERREECTRRGVAENRNRNRNQDDRGALTHLRPCLSWSWRRPVKHSSRASRLADLMTVKNMAEQHSATYAHSSADAHVMSHAARHAWPSASSVSRRVGDLLSTCLRRSTTLRLRCGVCASRAARSLPLHMHTPPLVTTAILPKRVVRRHVVVSRCLLVQILSAFHGHHLRKCGRPREDVSGSATEPGRIGRIR